MRKNMGGADRIIRLVVAAELLILCLTLQPWSMLHTGLLIMTGIFVLTSAVSYCPFYSQLGLNTADPDIN